MVFGRMSHLAGADGGAIRDPSTRIRSRIPGSGSRFPMRSEGVLWGSGLARESAPTGALFAGKPAPTGPSRAIAPGAALAVARDKG